MRQDLILTAGALIFVIVAIWGMAVVIASHPKDTDAAPAPASIDATQMMKDAKTLPVEKFEAH